MTRIDKFHALPIGKQLTALAHITSIFNSCKYCVYADRVCFAQACADKKKTCDAGRALWWLQEYKSDF